MFMEYLEKEEKFFYKSFQKMGMSNVYPHKYSRRKSLGNYKMIYWWVQRNYRF